MKAFILWMLFSMCLHISDTCATEPSAQGGDLPDAYFERTKNNPHAFVFKRALHDVAARASIARAVSASSTIFAASGSNKLIDNIGNLLETQPLYKPIEGGPPTMVAGVRTIPVLTMLFYDTQAIPFPTKDLQTELFDGPWPTGTMTDYYKEVSNGALTVRGTVKDWRRLSNPSKFYVGENYLDEKGNSIPCFSLCSKSRIADFLIESLRDRDDIDWGMFDNDGPDGIPNSGDDDGFVDFVAFVHPNVGSECDNNPQNIWSHRSSLTSWGRPAFVTKSKRKGGGFIAIDDYVIMPGLACDGKKMIEIGVFAHEFGHAFGLPDLYDTDKTDGRTAGLGNWCLMASGSWGADGHTPSVPVHMSPWAKAFLGWIDLKDVDQDLQDIPLKAIEDSHVAYRLRISSKIYYIINATKKVGFDRNLPAEGLQIWKVNDTVVKAGLSSNTVNAVNGNAGIELVEADGLSRLTSEKFRGDAGDLFPGKSANSYFDGTRDPRTIGNVSVCNIHKVENEFYATLRPTKATCKEIKINSSSTVLTTLTGIQNSTPGLNQEVGRSEKNVSIPEAVSAPVGKQVAVKGTLKNRGHNFFDRKTRQLILTDKSGNEIEVVPGTAIETPPSPNNTPPHQISEVINKEVTIYGQIAPAVSENAKAALKAESIKINK